MVYKGRYQLAKPVKYVFVTGGVLSGLGKGITAASIGNILEARGLRVNIQKLDPYLNVDAGTLNPSEHGECFVTFDGAETDLDLGHYERFLNIQLSNKSSVMSGKLLRKLIDEERNGKFLGKTVQLVPHFTEAIIEAVIDASTGFDVHIVEIGGTVGDYESPAFFEAIRELGDRVGSQNCVYVQVVYLPYLSTSKEIKTKPAQNAVRSLRSMGIIPDVLVARSEVPTNGNTRGKLSAFCGVPKAGVAILPNARTVYEVPLTLENQGIGEYITNKLDVNKKKPNLKNWQKLVNTIISDRKPKFRIGVVAKYLDNQDTYMSVFEALRAASWELKVDLDLKWVDAEKLSKKRNYIKELEKLDGIVVPGGFGERGVEGKIIAAQYSLKNNLPYLGLCLGMQVGVIAAARNHGIKDATSEELNSKSKNLVINTMNSQIGKENTGGTMRLGNYTCIIDKHSQTAKLYKKTKIEERHRHRYEANNDYVGQYESWGIKPVGKSPDGNLVEIIEASDHRFFIGSQFHPEFNSRPNVPHPLFVGFVKSLKK